MMLKVNLPHKTKIGEIEWDNVWEMCRSREERIQHSLINSGRLRRQRRIIKVRNISMVNVGKLVEPQWKRKSWLTWRFKLTLGLIVGVTTKVTNSKNNNKNTRNW